MDKRSSARDKWEKQVSQRIDAGTLKEWEPIVTELHPPSDLRAEAGSGQVTLHWSKVEGAIGYLIYRSESPDGPFTIVDHRGGDVLAVPDAPYADTTGKPGVVYWYTVASLADTSSSPSQLSAAVQACSHAKVAETMLATVKTQTPGGHIQRIWHTLGSEHLSLLFHTEGPGGSQIGSEFAEALRLARTELGTQYIRAHAILNDDLDVYKQTNGEIIYNFKIIDDVYDCLLNLGLRPIIELSFMPRDLASSTTETVFTYGSLISPPRDWQTWEELIYQFASHLVARYGIEEVASWGFEVWNEANLKVFWTASQQDYFKLYHLAARAIKAVDRRLLVGGPATAAAEWLGDFLQFVRQVQAPLDFLSTHTYGNLPLDVRRLLYAAGFEHVHVWWTEWGVSPTHFAPVNDSVFAATFLLHGIKRAQGKADMLAYWVVSDHFEELGRAPRLLHGGFGLLTIGNLRKPRYLALALAQDLGTQLVQLDLQGDGAGSLVDAWASRKPDGSIDLLLWNGTLNQAMVTGNDLLDRRLLVRIEQLAAPLYRGSLARIDATHSNIAAHWSPERDWPTPEEWEMLHRADTLDETPLPTLSPLAGCVSLALDLPMPGILRVRLVPDQRPIGDDR
ncbi:GH39 family glycosyl hydrolase [Ktedonobacter racemifer]|uniref:Xylan 1,4-beta-xylosidase n=1 Tax=Ktedonobacter racemifer DSM 44963 TaxID=485913 RepID=D6TT42_KTERA|nr:xylan 1,4-beta-xylosidase [Ktedonobacter racemifer]EFH83593.1 Xylan 1,4-beta-xylosidase [Ktedonobacter racemifer DSM 44963]